MKRLAAFCILFIPSVLLAQVNFNGFMEYDQITYFRNMDSLSANGRNQIVFNPKISHALKDNIRLFTAIEFRHDQADPSRNRVFLDEAYMDMYFDDFDLRIGRQFFNWGRADGFNPTDNLSAWDFSDLLDIEDEKLGQVAISTKYYFDNWTMEGVLLSAFTPSKLPTPNSRWWVQLSNGVTNPYYPLFGPEFIPVTYREFPTIVPGFGLESFQYAFRLSGYTGGWDYSVSWFDGYDDLPAIHSDLTLDSMLTNGQVDYWFQYHKRKAFGTDLATTFGKLSLRGEAAYYLTEDTDGNDPAIDDPYLQYVVGADYSLTDVIADHDIWLQVEWIQEVQVPDLDTEYRVTDLNHVFRKSLMGVLQYKFNDYVTLETRAIYNLYAKDWLVSPSLQWSVTDGLVLDVKSNLLWGSKDSFFGTYSGNDRAQVRIKYSF